LRAVVFAPETLCRLCRRRCCFRPRSRPEELSDADDGSGFALEEDSADFGELAAIAPKTCADSATARLRTLWDIFSVFLCVAILLGLGCSVVLAFYASLNSVDWRQYERSPKLQDLRKILVRLGVNETSWQDAISHYKAEVADVATTMLGVAGDVIITLLLFLFCLVAILPGIRSDLPRSRMRALMQRYLLCKTVTSALIALAVMLSLWLMDVNLVFIFGMVTFLCNFIPNVGSFFAIVAPAPLVYLTPGKTVEDVVIAVVVPFLIHNTLGCIVEPQLMQAGLDLHPLTTVVALTFWGAIWGISGMILSVPITCGIKLALAEVDHPHAKLLFDILDKPLRGRSRRRPIITPPSSDASGRDTAE